MGLRVNSSGVVEMGCLLTLGFEAGVMGIYSAF